jgi:hypothetical protein
MDAKHPATEANVLRVGRLTYGYETMVPAIRTTEGWWIRANAVPELPDGVEGGHASVSAFTYARSSIFPGKWKNKLGWVFAVEEARTVIQTLEGKSMFGPRPPETGLDQLYYLPCSFSGSGAPACSMAKIVEPRNDGTWPSPEEALKENELP